MRRLARIAVPLSLLVAAWAVIAFQPHHRRCVPTGSPDMAVRHPAMDCQRCHGPQLKVHDGSGRYKSAFQPLD
jgi:hypothetical protein